MFGVVCSTFKTNCIIISFLSMTPYTYILHNSYNYYVSSMVPVEYQLCSIISIIYIYELYVVYVLPYIYACLGYT